MILPGLHANSGSSFCVMNWHLRATYGTSCKSKLVLICAQYFIRFKKKPSYLNYGSSWWKKWGKSMLFRRTNWEEETWWNERFVVIDSCGAEILELGSGFQKEDLTDLWRVSKDSFLLIHIWAITWAVTEIIIYVIYVKQTFFRNYIFYPCEWNWMSGYPSELEEMKSNEENP